MEIRNALQKIENYLTVVSNLNKTILSEGTMSRDELLLMKKYLYTSIDRIEDIEKSLVVNKSENDTTSTNDTPIPAFVPKVEKEIVEVQQQTDVEALEAKLEENSSDESLEKVEEITTESSESIAEEADTTLSEIPMMEIEPMVENIITEDYAINQTTIEETEVEYPVELTAETSNVDTIVNVQNDEIEKSDDFIMTPLVESTIITEDYSVNKLEADAPINEELTVPLVENIITEDYAVNHTEQQSVVMENQSDIPSNKEEKELTFAEKFLQEKPSTLADVLAENKKEEVPFFQKFEQKTQQHLFELFEEDTAEEMHTPVVQSTAFVPEHTQVSYGDESVLVVEKQTKTMVEELTPSSLNDVFKPQTATVSIKDNAVKTLSESIALNDKFIFVRELFGNQFAEYEKGLKQLDLLPSFSSADQYCKDNLWSKYNWSDKTVAVERFMEVLQKRYN